MTNTSTMPALDPTVRLAADPATHDNVLAQLAQSPDPQVREAVAGNPNTPEPLLQELALEFPHAFAANPVLPLLSLADPGYAKKLSVPVVLSLLRCEEIPPLVLAGELKGSWVQDALSMHVARAGEATGDWRRAVRKHLDRSSLQYIAQYILLPDLIPAWLFELALAEGEWGELATSHATPPSLLGHYAQSSDEAVRRCAAHNPHTPIPALTVLARDDAKAVRQAVAHNTAAPPEVLHLLLGDSEAEVRRAVAYHPRVAAADLAVLARDGEEMVRVAAARHTGLSADALNALAADPSDAVRASVAGNPSLPPHLLEGLAFDGEAAVRRGALRNPRLARTVRAKLARDANAEVRRAALRQRPAPPTTEEEWRRRPRDVAWYRALAGDALTPLPVLRALAGDAQTSVRAAVARNHHTPTDLLETLASDPEWPVLLAVARNPRTSYAVLLSMAAYAKPILCHAIVHHPNVGRVRRQEVYERFLLTALEIHHALERKYPSLGNVFEREYHWHRLLTLAVVRHDAAALGSGARSFDWGDRLMVALNPHAPRELHEMLTHDGNRFVRAAARQTLAQNVQVNTTTEAE